MCTAAVAAMMCLGKDSLTEPLTMTAVLQKVSVYEVKNPCAQLVRS